MAPPIPSDAPPRRAGCSYQLCENRTLCASVFRHTGYWRDVLENADELPARQRRVDRVCAELQTERRCDSDGVPVRRMLCRAQISNYVTASPNPNTYGPAGFCVSLVRTFWVLLCGASNQIRSHVDGTILRRRRAERLAVAAVLQRGVMAAETAANSFKIRALIGLPEGVRVNPLK